MKSTTLSMNKFAVNQAINSIKESGVTVKIKLFPYHKIEDSKNINCKINKN
jgi:biotin operon repressor